MFTTEKSAPRAGDMTDPHLWSRIRMAPLPATRDGREFFRALAHANDLPLSEARDIELEYRRFLYLAAIDSTALVVPAQIRKAWQLHAQSPEYVPFCASVLGKPLPLDDTSRMLGAAHAYRETRTAYQREFGNRPPRLYWPEGVAPRVPRWLAAHAAILGFSGSIAYGQAQPLYFAAGVGLALALYGLDLYSSHLGRSRNAFGDRMSDDLTHFLNQTQGH
jgi:hypothetical protein